MEQKVDIKNVKMYEKQLSKTKVVRNKGTYSGKEYDKVTIERGIFPSEIEKNRIRVTITPEILEAIKDSGMVF